MHKMMDHEKLQFQLKFNPFFIIVHKKAQRILDHLISHRDIMRQI